MKVFNKIGKILKIPFKFIYQVGSSPIKFVYKKQKKLIKIISPSNVKIVGIKIYKGGKRIIITTVFIVSIISSSGVESQKKMIENSFILPAKLSIERVIELPCGGAVNHPWSPGAKYQSNSTKTSSGKAQKLRHRRLFSIKNPNSPFNSGQQTPNPAYRRSAKALNNNKPKSGRGIRVRSIAKTDENGKMKTIYYNRDGQIEEVHHQNSGLTKARNNLTPIEDDRLTPEGDFVHPSQLTSKGRYVIDKTKNRRAAPLLQSKYEDKDKEFLPAYSIPQITKKDNHTRQILEKLGKNLTQYDELPKNKQLEIDLTIVEELLAHPDTELHMNVMGQGREPIAMLLNRGLGTYPLQNHIGTFERRPEICKYNPYITNYLANKNQIKAFDLSKNTSISYEDLVGNSHTNIGPIFGKIDSPTSRPTVNEGKSEL